MAVGAAGGRGAGALRAKFYLVQHYESLYHGDADAVDATYRLPLTKIVISTWLRDVMRERFGARGRGPGDPRSTARSSTPSRRRRRRPPRVLMLHHDYAWKGVADGLAAVARVRARRRGSPWSASA